MPQNGINHAGVTALATALQHNKGLRIINLNDNTFTEKGAVAMAQVNHPLTYCKISLAGCLFVYLLSVYLFIYPLSFCLPDYHISVYRFICHLSVYLSFYLSVSHFNCLFVLFVFLIICTFLFFNE